MKHDYSDCLKPEYTIPGLITTLLDACNITGNKPSYDFWSDGKGYANGGVLELMKSAPLLVKTPTAYPPSVEGIYKIYAASKSTPVTSLDLDFEVLVSSSFHSNDGPLTSGEIK